jgi:hypothetical protein
MENYGQPARRQRPGGLTAICVIAIVLGGMGVCAGLMGLASPITTSWMEKAMAAQHKAARGNPASEAQFEMQKKMQGVTRQYLAYTVGLSVINLLVSGGLCIGAIIGMRTTPRARKFLICVFWAAIGFEIVQMIVQSSMQVDISAVMSESMSRVMAANPQGGPTAAQAAQFGKVFATVTVVLGMAFVVVWGLAQVVYYAVGIRYLGRPAIRQLFEETSESREPFRGIAT